MLVVMLIRWTTLVWEIRWISTLVSPKEGGRAELWCGNKQKYCWKKSRVVFIVLDGNHGARCSSEIAVERGEQKSARVENAVGWR